MNVNVTFGTVKVFNFIFFPQAAETIFTSKYCFAGLRQRQFNSRISAVFCPPNLQDSMFLVNSELNFKIYTIFLCSSHLHPISHYHVSSYITHHPAPHWFFFCNHFAFCTPKRTLLICTFRQRCCHPHSRFVRGAGEKRGQRTARLATTPDRVRSCASRVRLPSAGRWPTRGGKSQYRQIPRHNQEGYRPSLLEQGHAKWNSCCRSAGRL